MSALALSRRHQLAQTVVQRGDLLIGQRSQQGVLCLHMRGDSLVDQIEPRRGELHHRAAGIPGILGPCNQALFGQLVDACAYLADG